MSDTYYLLALLASLTLLMLLIVRGKSIFVVAPLSALVAVTLSGFDPVAAMTGPYMAGFSDYVRKFYLIFALGAVFGKMMEDSGAATSVARSVARWLGAQHACLAVVLACAILTYGGVSLFVVGFSTYPLAVLLFREANLPRRFIPASIAFGSVTFTMTSAGSPEIQNLIPRDYLNTTALAGWPASLIVAVLMFVAGQLYLQWAIRHDVARGARFEPRARDASLDQADGRALPGLAASMTPLVVTLLSLNVLPHASHSLAEWLEPVTSTSTFGLGMHKVLLGIPEDGTLAIFLGVVAGLLVFRGQLSNVWTCFGDGFVNGLLAVGSTAAVVGFGAAVKDLPGFKIVVTWVTSIPGDPLISAAIAVAVIAGIAGSASGGQGIALPILKPIYVDELGVAPQALHRVVSIASGSLDSLPANGYLVMLIRNICGETHARAYGPIFFTTVLVPAGGTALAILLFKLFPAWQRM